MQLGLFAEPVAIAELVVIEVSAAVEVLAKLAVEVSVEPVRVEVSAVLRITVQSVRKMLYVIKRILILIKEILIIFIKILVTIIKKLSIIKL